MKYGNEYSTQHRHNRSRAHSMGFGLDCLWRLGMGQQSCTLKTSQFSLSLSSVGLARCVVSLLGFAHSRCWLFSAPCDWRRFYTDHAFPSAMEISRSYEEGE